MSSTAHESDPQILANFLEAAAYWAQSSRLVHGLIDVARTSNVDANALLGGSLEIIPATSPLREEASSILGDATRLGIAGHMVLLQPLGAHHPSQPESFQRIGASLLERSPVRAFALTDNLESIRFRLSTGPKKLPDQATFALDASVMLGQLCQLADSNGCDLGLQSPIGIEDRIQHLAIELRGTGSRLDEVRHHNASVQRSRELQKEVDWVPRLSAAQEAGRLLWIDPDIRRDHGERALAIAKAAQASGIAAARQVHAHAHAVAQLLERLRFDISALDNGRGSMDERSTVKETVSHLIESLERFGGSAPVDSLGPFMRGAQGRLESDGGLDVHWGESRQAVAALADAVTQWQSLRAKEPVQFDWRTSRFSARGAVMATLALPLFHAPAHALSPAAEKIAPAEPCLIHTRRQAQGMRA
ncbi:hypothetical protein CBP36_19570 (plasmid) [Acidovorax carolinensis]|uniref:Uncharacterized protein n=1 Tax=Acidovorax carolinensis TaxID=553814 RepID=A0A240UI71_9BURK|nr:hypothetical protein [Acidovorax carolinensis]ART57107.1 hypothetical protein CBP35_19525 [Acidovorax carolinensis]ART61168.1 hypothetical protein CBP36_19570 [Acidovorax carolinensis]